MFYIIKYYATTGKRDKCLNSITELETFLCDTPIMAVTSIKKYYGDYEIEDLTTKYWKWAK